MHGIGSFAVVSLTIFLSVPALAQPTDNASSALAPPVLAIPANTLSENPFYQGLFLTGEYLLLQPRRGDWEMGILVPGTTAPATVESLQWNLTSGLRFGAGYRSTTGGWDIGTSFTYFHSPFNRTVTAPPGGAFFPSMSLVGFGAVDAADGDVSLSYGTFDLEVGHTFDVSDSLSLRLIGGLRIARIDQNLKCIYSGGSLGSDEDFINNPVHFLGAGFTVGGDATWMFSKKWGVYGRAQAALLSGQFSSRMTESVARRNGI